MGFLFRARLFVGGAIFAAVMSGSLSATTLDFNCLTNNGNGCTGMVSQLEVEVNSPGSGQVEFKFNNNGPTASNVTEIYWDDDAGVLLGFGSPKYTASGSGVQFVNGSVNPADLPSGMTASPSFGATFAVDSASGAAKGINPNEWLKVLFLLQSSKTYNDVLQALEAGTLRIGMHVRSIGTAGGSDSVLNVPYTPLTEQGNVPEPATFGIVGAGLLAAAIARRVRR